jgi:hypothetical protein
VSRFLTSSRMNPDPMYRFGRVSITVIATQAASVVTAKTMGRRNAGSLPPSLAVGRIPGCRERVDPDEGDGDGARHGAEADAERGEGERRRDGDAQGAVLVAGVEEGRRPPRRLGFGARGA